MRNKILFLILLVSLSTKAQNDENLDKYNLRGSVKTVETSLKSASTGKQRKWTKHYFNEKGFLIKEETQFATNAIQKRQLFYDDAGNILLDTNKKREGRVEYSFDNQGKLIGIISPGSKTTFTHNSNGNIEKEIRFDTNQNVLKTSLEYKYNSDGSYQTIAKYYFEDGTIWHQDNCTYNSKNQIIEKQNEKDKTLYFYTNDNLVKEEHYTKGQLKETKLYKYRYDGLLLNETQIADGKTESFSIEYDDFGNETKVSEGNESDTFTYEYDNQNNWIKKSKYDGGNVSYVTTRQIAYYNEKSEDTSKPIPFALLDTQPTINNCNEPNCFGKELSDLINESVPKNRYIEFGISNPKRINLSFVIEKDGSFSNILVYRALKDFKEHIIQQLQSIKATSVGAKDGKPVRTVFSMPIVF